jgi:hypothetical protein
MANPHRGRGGSMNGRGGGATLPRRAAEPSSNHRANDAEESQTPSDNVPNHRGRGWPRGPGSRGSSGRGGNPDALGGRGGGAFRGRRGQGVLWNGS